MTGAASAGPVNTTERLQALRKQMKKHDISTYLVGSEDAHSSEYTAPCDQRRAYITGFTGSAGTAIIQSDRALLFTDGRYFMQASKELDSNWTLMKYGEKDVPSWQDYLCKLESERIGVDPSLVTYDDFSELQKSLHRSSVLRPIAEGNLVDSIWSDRPPRPEHPVNVHTLEFSGRSIEDKLIDIRNALQKLKKPAVATVLNMLDEVAWLCNLRGTDVPYNPVFFAYAIVTMQDATLFVDAAKLDDSVYKHLGNAVKVRPYEHIILAGQELGKNLKSDEVVLFGKTASLAVVEAVGKRSETANSPLENVSFGDSVINEAKSVKNDVELEGFRQSHIRDGAALCAYFAWLEETLAQGVKINEYDAASKLEEFRSKQPLFRGLSFPTISSTGSNGAIIHYGPPAEGSAIIDPNDMYLCDSGGHYSDGTTDVTRTLHFGQPTAEQIDAFTRVLMGHIEIDMFQLPVTNLGCNGYRLDALARMYLWENGLDYRHGTGHGVGSYLNVHEGPMGIGMRPHYRDHDLKIGQCLSNEPGYYKDGHWGIRIENLILIKEIKNKDYFGGAWVGAEHITMAPMQTKLVDKSLLRPKHLTWLNDYHAEVLEKLSPLLKDDPRALAWLEKECRAI